MSRVALVTSLALIVGGALPAAAEEAAPLTLADCYALALKRSETIAIQQELIHEAEARFIQSRSGILPRVSFSSSDKRQSGSGGSAFTLQHVPERKFTFSQPLFSGFKEFAAMTGSRAEQRQRLDEKRHAEHLLLVDVADAFYLLREMREDLNALEITRAALVERLDELNTREQLGRSRPSEVANAETQLRRVEAEMERVRGDETAARQLLEFLTGRESLEGITDNSLPLPDVEPLQTYLRFTDQRPDVEAAAEAARVAAEERTIAQAKFWPSVNLEGNYYTERVGVAQDVDWDVTLKADVPLFQGGQTVGAVKEAKARERVAQLLFEKAKRDATLDIQNAYADVEAALARGRAFERSLDAAQESYRLQREDYRLSLVSNLDVLQAIQTLEDARREVIHAHHESKRLYWRLRIATGAPP